MPNILRFVFANVNTVMFAAIALYTVTRRSGVFRRLWRWFWA